MCTLIPAFQEADADSSLSSRPAWKTQKTLSQKTKKKVGGRKLTVLVVQTVDYRGATPFYFGFVMCLPPLLLPLLYLDISEMDLSISEG